MDLPSLDENEFDGLTQEEILLAKLCRNRELVADAYSMVLLEEIDSTTLDILQSQSSIEIAIRVGQASLQLDKEILDLITIRSVLILKKIIYTVFEQDEVPTEEYLPRLLQLLQKEQIYGAVVGFVVTMYNKRAM